MWESQTNVSGNVKKRKLEFVLEMQGKLLVKRACQTEEMAIDGEKEIQYVCSSTASRILQHRC
jgi:hypothetical protein